MENEVWLFYENLKAISFYWIWLLNFKQYEFEKIILR